MREVGGIDGERRLLAVLRQLAAERGAVPSIGLVDDSIAERSGVRDSADEPCG